MANPAFSDLVNTAGPSDAPIGNRQSAISALRTQDSRLTSGLSTQDSGLTARRRGFTLVEMLTTVALLIIALGLMVSLARYVRRRSAEDLTRRLLLNLDRAMRSYMSTSPEPLRVEILKSFSDFPRNLAEPAMVARALDNNHRFVALLEASKPLSDIVFHDLPLSIYEPGELRDAWGMPIVFMPQDHPQVGMAPKAPGGEWFFFSAGPDRLYLTRDDNQYSYEGLGP